MNKTVLLSAGGTGGHLFPAQALAQVLKARGWTIHLATDPRAKAYVDSFPADKIHIVESATFAGKSPLALAKTLFKLTKGYFVARGIVGSVAPQVTVGFGGYPTVPPLLAATHKGVDTVLHEQNAVIGRANRFLAGKVTVLATGFPLTNVPGDLKNPVVVTGNPIRQVAHDVSDVPYVASGSDEPFELVVFGGSQGARFFSDMMPEALKVLPDELKRRVRLTMQARPEDVERVTKALNEMGIAHEVNPFFSDMPKRIAGAHLVICRSGASSVSELALIGRPSILVPLPGALDDDQGANATQLEAAGGARLMRQNTITPENLADCLNDLMSSPDGLAKQAENAKKAGMPLAAELLADLVEAQL